VIHRIIMCDDICTAAFMTSLACLSYPDLGWNWSFITSKLTEPISTFCHYSSPEIISCSNIAVLPCDRVCCAWTRSKICVSGSRPSEPPSSRSRASWPMMTCLATFVGPRTDRDSFYNSCPLLKKGGLYCHNLRLSVNSGTACNFLVYSS
jgi:hypothetical protein